jgi:hypothetical protein
MFWLAQAIVSGVRGGASNGRREHTREKRRKDRRCGGLGSARHLITHSRMSPVCFSARIWVAMGRNFVQYAA